MEAGGGPQIKKTRDRLCPQVIRKPECEAEIADTGEGPGTSALPCEVIGTGQEIGTSCQRRLSGLFTKSLLSPLHKGAAVWDSRVGTQAASKGSPGHF